MRFKALDEKIKKTERARKGKWDKLAKGTPRNEPHCVLCDYGCSTCPIGFVTGDGCTRTPYHDWAEADLDCDDCPYHGSDKCAEKPCPKPYNSPEARKHAKRESRMLAAIQKGLEVMQRALAKIE